LYDSFNRFKLAPVVDKRLLATLLLRHFPFRTRLGIAWQKIHASPQAIFSFYAGFFAPAAPRATCYPAFSSKASLIPVW